MFCVLNVKERKRRIFHGNPPYKSEKIIIPKTAVFEKLTVFSYGKKIDYRAVKEHLKSFSKSVVFCEGVVLSADSGIFEYRSDELKAYMTFNSAVRLLDAVKNKKRLNLVLADKTGDYSLFLERAVLLAGNVTVFTDNSLRYQFAADEVYENYGAIVNIKPFDSKMSDCDVFISLSSSGRYPLSICVKNISQGGFVRLQGDGFTLPERIKKYIPDSVNCYSFVSALFSLSAVRELGSICYDSFLVNSRPVSVSSAFKMLDTLLIF